jgi:hypothetical protein
MHGQTSYSWFAGTVVACLAAAIVVVKACRGSHLLRLKPFAQASGARQSRLRPTWSRRSERRTHRPFATCSTTAPT